MASRKALHDAWKQNFVPRVASIFLKFPEIEGFGNEELIVMPCNSHWLVEDLTEYLLRLGLRMTDDERFADFAIVHGKYGLSMPCSWLHCVRDGDVATVEFKPEDEFLNLDLAGYGYEAEGWIHSRGHGFVLSRNDDYDTWLDFVTGQTVVTLH